ncbi:MAG TPA: cytochrome C [Thermomicrobiales bacterium]|jgi:hypothetical protein|nr:cytochrome C [Thermomicrobiales bacterium]
MVATHHNQAAQAVKPAAHGLSQVRIGLDARLARFFLQAGAGILLVASMFYPYWEITLHAPQYPRGLFIQTFVNKMEPARNVFEVDGLNHYIGMIKLTDAATIEQAISVYAIPAVALLATASFLVTGIWRTLLRLPVILYPVIFAVDLFSWLYYAGHTLDPKAPMSSSIKEFTPKILGKGTIGQFHTEANFTTGFYLAAAAAVITLVVAIWERWSRHAQSE